MKYEVGQQVMYQKGKGRRLLSAKVVEVRDDCYVVEDGRFFYMTEDKLREAK